PFPNPFSVPAEHLQPNLGDRRSHDAPSGLRSVQRPADLAPLVGWRWEPLAAHPRLSRGLSRGARSIVLLFLSGELLLGKLSETVVVVGNAPHDRPGFFVCHLIRNCASFFCTKAPMIRVPKS